jgi:hypothetical protein
MTIEQINAEMAMQMERYKKALRKLREASDTDNRKYQEEMARSIQRLSELLNEKRRLKNEA